MSSINPSTSNPKLTKAGVLAIGFVVGLAILPIAYRSIPLEVARWRVAFARNQIRDNKLEEAETTLRIARLKTPALESDVDFLVTEAELMLAQGEPDRVIESLINWPSSALPYKKERLGKSLSLYFLEMRDFDRAYQAQRSYYAQTTQSDEAINSFAYTRSLAKADLEQALKDIEPVSTNRNDAAALDTKAWILFQLGEYSQAVELLDKAVPSARAQLVAQQLFPGIDPVPENDSSLSKKDQQSVDRIRTHFARIHSIASIRRRRDHLAGFQGIHSFAVMRYHRARALEENGQNERAQEDWAWLRFHGFEDDSILY